MSKNTSQDLADKALAEEFGLYISLVAKDIVKPVENAAIEATLSINKVTIDTEKSIRNQIDTHQNRFSKDSDMLCTQLVKSTDEFQYGQLSYLCLTNGPLVHFEINQSV